MIKKYLNISLLFITVISFSCRKNNVDMPNFDVSTLENTYKVGQKITFNFSGTPENISFWSGEKGRAYANRNRTIEQGVTQTLQFTSQAGAGTQNNNLTILVSKDFDGTYTAPGIAKATWTDITSRAILSPNEASGVAGASTSSGAINIKDQGNANNTPVYVGFRYLAASNTLIPRPWTISSFTVTNTLADGVVNGVVPSLATAGFRGVDIQNSSYQFSFTPNSTNPTSLSMTAGPAGTAVNEDWTISAPILLNTVALSDYGVSVASLGTLSRPTSYTYTYTVAGTYLVTFTAFNQNVDDKKGFIKQFTLTIIP